MQTQELRYAERGRLAPRGARDWTAEIGEDPQSGVPAETVLFCPDCWEREFGGS